MTYISYKTPLTHRLEKRKARLNFTYKVILNDQVIQRCETHNKRRFYNKISSIEWEDRGISVLLRINYGKHLNNKGKLVSFFNEGVYDSRQDLQNALDAFVENA